MNEVEIILYEIPDNQTALEVRFEDDTVWLTQAQMAELFQTTRNNITLHISNVFKENELEQLSVSKESLLTAADGKNYKTNIYNLDVIISVGYRVKSHRGTQFRIWANKVLKNYNLDRRTTQAGEWPREIRHQWLNSTAGHNWRYCREKY